MHAQRRCINELRNHGLPDYVSNLLIRKATSLKIWHEQMRRGAIKRNEEGRPYRCSNITGEKVRYIDDIEANAKNDIKKCLSEYNIQVIYQYTRQTVHVKLRFPNFFKLIELKDEFASRIYGYDPD